MEPSGAKAWSEIQVGIVGLVRNGRGGRRLEISGLVAAPPEFRASEVEEADFTHVGDNASLFDDVEMVDSDALGPALGDNEGFSRR